MKAACLFLTLALLSGCTQEPSTAPTEPMTVGHSKGYTVIIQPVESEEGPWDVIAIDQIRNQSNRAYVEQLINEANGERHQDYFDGASLRSDLADDWRAANPGKSWENPLAIDLDEELWSIEFAFIGY